MPALYDSTELAVAIVLQSWSTQNRMRWEAKKTKPNMRVIAVVAVVTQHVDMILGHILQIEELNLSMHVQCKSILRELHECTQQEAIAGPSI